MVSRNTRTGTRVIQWEIFLSVNGPNPAAHKNVIFCSRRQQNTSTCRSGYGLERNTVSSVFLVPFSTKERDEPYGLFKVRCCDTKHYLEADYAAKDGALPAMERLRSTQ